MKLHGSGIDTLQLPEFAEAPTLELRIFLKSFFVLELGDSYLYQHYACTAILILSLLCGFFILFQSIQKRRFWVFRVQRLTTTGNNMALIPEPTSSFVFYVNLYFMIWIAYTYYSRAVDKQGLEGKLRGYFLVIVWYLCLLGAWLGAVGTLYISPGATLRDSGSSNRWKNLVPSPSIVNIFSVGFPILILIGSLVPGMLGGQEYSQAWQKWSRLNSELLSQASTAAISPEQSEAALEIWKQLCECYFRVSLGFLFLAIGASFLFVGYVIMSVSLALLLRSQIKDTEILFGHRVSLNIEEMEHRTETWESVKANQIERAAAEEETRAAQSLFFPPVTGAIPQIASADSPESRSRTLREALRTIVILSVTINLGVLIYATWLIYICSNYYEAALRGPKALTDLHRVYHLIAAWNGTIIGSLGFYLISYRTHRTFYESLPRSPRSVQRMKSWIFNIKVSSLQSTSKRYSSGRIDEYGLGLFERDEVK